MEYDLIHNYSKPPGNPQKPKKKYQMFFKEIKAVQVCALLPFFAILIHNHLWSKYCKTISEKDCLYYLNNISQYLPASVVRLYLFFMVDSKICSIFHM